MADEKKVVKKVVKKAKAAAGDVANTGVDAAKGALGAVGGAIGGLGKKAKSAAKKAVDVAGDVVENAKDTATGVANAAQDAAGDAVVKAKGAAKKVSAKAKIVAGDAMGAVKGAATKAGDIAHDIAEDAMDAVETLADGAVDMTKAAAAKAQDVAGDAVDAVKGVGGKALGAGAAVLGGAAAIAAGAGKKAKDIAHDVTEDAMGAAKGAADGAMGLVSGVASGAADVANDVAQTVVGGKKGGALMPTIAMIAVGGLLAYGLISWSNKNGANVNAPVVSNVSAPTWFAGLGDKIKAKFDWLKLDFKGGSVVASGEAADTATRDAALKALEAEITSGEGKGANIVNNISVKGVAEKPVGAALAALGDNPDAAACNTAFTDTMAGRTINFATGKATINSDSNALLSALTGIATACKAHKIEVAGHTDAQGDANANKDLSQSRADAVKAFWVSKGVPSEGLVATGYGASKLLDTATGAAADAKNRRVEFVVSAK